jgi:hypothetical protein
MWILPKQLHTSLYVPDTAALISDLNEQSQACAQSLLVRSKPSPARTWSLKWKRDSWTQLLSGRILKPSHGPSFVDAWTSSVAATRASHSAQPASASAPKTQDTSGLTYQPELLQCDQVPVSLKMSRDISRWGCPTSSKTWQEWVTERRGAWRQRVNAARRTRGSGSLSWPTATATDSSDMSPNPRPSRLATNRKTEYLARMVHWPTANARDWKDSITGTHPPSRPKMSEQTLGQAVSVIHGQAAPASSSLSGSRQGLSEPSQRNWQTFAPGTNNRGMTPHRQVVKALVSGDKAQTQMLTVDQVFAEEIKGTNRQELWLTPRANEPDSDPNFAARNADRGAHCHGTLSSQAKGEQWRTPTSFDWKNTDCSTQVYLSDQVEGRTSKQTDFPTPRTCDWKSSPNASQNEKRTEAGQATLAEFVHAKHKKGDLWSTPRTGATESSRPNNKGGIPLADQAKREQWGTPTARDHKSGRGNEHRQYKELTPMVERTQSGKLNPRWVETLMGLPIGWTMPSCTSPQTIAPMSCDSLAMELSLPPQSGLSEFSFQS